MVVLLLKILKNYIKNKYNILYLFRISNTENMIVYVRSYCLYIIFCVKILLLDFKKAVLELFYNTRVLTDRICNALHL